MFKQGRILEGLAREAFFDVLRFKHSLDCDKLGDKWEVNFSSHKLGRQAFSLDLNSKICFDGSLRIKNSRRGQGYGRLLVDAQEFMCRKLEISAIVINYNRNDSFWEHLGYCRLGCFGNFLLKNAISSAGIEFDYSFFPPRYRIL